VAEAIISEEELDAMLAYALADAGLRIADISKADLAVWVAGMIDRVENAAKLMEAEYYSQMASAMTGAADPAQIEAARAMWRDQARIQAKTLTTNMIQADLKTLSQTIAQGIKDGAHPFEVARRLDMVKGLDSQRAAALTKKYEYWKSQGLSEEVLEKKLNRERERLLRERRETIARTEMRQAHAEGEMQTALAEGAKYKVWQSTGDARVSDECAANEAQGPIDAKEAFSSGAQHPPAHPSCLVGETAVFAPDKIAAFIATYRGPVFDITTACGSGFTVTANHMLVTPNGFVKAQSVCEGDYILYCPVIQRTGFCSPYNDRRPSRIDQAIESLAESPGVSIRRVPLSPEYLHGDGRFLDGYIDIVAPNGFLRGDINSAPIEHVDKLCFERTDANLLGLDCLRNFVSMLVALRDATDGGVGIRSESSAFVRRKALHPQEVCIASVASANAVFSEDSGYNRSAGAKTLSNAQLGLSLPISKDDSFGVNVCPRILKSRDAVDAQNMIHPTSRCSERIRNVLGRFSGHIAITRIVRIVQREFFGHVFDLHTLSTFYHLDGALSSNCRCSVSWIASDSARDREKGRAAQRAEQTAAARDGE